MAETYAEFAAQHRAEHSSDFIRWSAVLGNYSNVPTAVALLLRRPRLAAAIFAAGTAALVAGHLFEGNLRGSLRDLARHPLWSIRADFALANSTLRRDTPRPT